MKYSQIKDLKEELFRRLTGIKAGTFNRMVQILSEADKKKKAKGGRRNKLSIEDRLLMALEYFDSVAIFETPFGTSKSPKGTKIVDKYACGSPGRPAYARYDTTRCHNFTSTNDLSTVLWALYFAFGKTSGTTVYQGLSASLLRRFLGRQRREYRTYFHISRSYGVSESAAYLSIKWLEDTLIKHPDFALPGRKALLKSDVEYSVVLVDASETPIQRPKKNKSVTTQGKRKGTP